MKISRKSLKIWEYRSENKRRLRKSANIGAQVCANGEKICSRKPQGSDLQQKYTYLRWFLSANWGGLGAKKVELNEERSDKDEESDDHDSFSVRLGVRKMKFLVGILYNLQGKQVFFDDKPSTNIYDQIKLHCISM